MNILNRIVIVLMLLAALAAVTILAAAPAEALGLLGAMIGGLKALADRLLPAGRALAALVGFGAAVLLLFWLWLEIRRPNHRTVRVRQTNGALAEVTTSTLVERLEYAVDALPGVLTAKARVRSFGGNVQVNLEVEIKPGLQVAQMAEEIAVAVREVAETNMGLALRGKPRIRIRAIRFPKEAFAEPEEKIGPPEASTPERPGSVIQLPPPALPPGTSGEQNRGANGEARELEAEPATPPPSRLP